VVLTQIIFEVAVKFGASGGVTTVTVELLEVAEQSQLISVTLKL
jgi:ribosomal protein S28E/S33